MNQPVYVEILLDMMYLLFSVPFQWNGVHLSGNIGVRRNSDRPLLGISSEDDADGEYDEDEDDEADVRELDRVCHVVIFLC